MAPAPLVVRTGLWSRVSALERLFADRPPWSRATRSPIRVSAVILDTSLGQNCTNLRAQCSLLLNGLRLTAASRHARSSSTPTSCRSVAEQRTCRWRQRSGYAEVDGDIITVGVERSCHADVLLPPSSQPADFSRPGPVVELAQDLRTHRR